MDGGPNARRWRGDYQRTDGPGGTERDTETGRSAALPHLRGRDSQLLYTFSGSGLGGRRKGIKEKLHVNSGSVWV